MVALNIVCSLFVQLVFTVGFIMLYGGLISLCNRCFYDACGNTAFGIVRLTGYVGTPVFFLVIASKKSACLGILAAPVLLDMWSILTIEKTFTTRSETFLSESLRFWQAAQ